MSEQMEPQAITAGTRKTPSPMVSTGIVSSNRQKRPTIIAATARERTEVLTMRLIDADGILKADENSDKALVLGNGKALEIAYALLKKKVADAPTVDAVVVTRCEDCVYWDDDPDTYGTDDGPKGKCMKSFETMCADGFCSIGERKPSADG